MTTQISRRQYLLAAGALLTAELAGTRSAQALETIRQGYQTNLWGMPTYYLLRSGLLEKRGIKFEEFGVPSGNLTMQQMVARQVDMGTYAGPSLILGHDKGGLVAIAQIEHVGKTASVMVRKDLGFTKIEQLKGLKIAKSADTVVAYLKAWLEVAKDFKNEPSKVADAIYSFYTSKGYAMSQDTFRKAMSYVDVDPGFPSDLKPYMQEQAEILLKEKKIAAIPDWSKALRPDFMEKARAGA